MGGKGYLSRRGTDVTEMTFMTLKYERQARGLDLSHKLFYVWYLDDPGS